MALQKIVYLYLNSRTISRNDLRNAVLFFLFESHFALTFLRTISPWIIVVYLEIPQQFMVQYYVLSDGLKDNAIVIGMKYLWEMLVTSFFLFLWTKTVLDLLIAEGYQIRNRRQLYCINFRININFSRCLFLFMTISFQMVRITYGKTGVDFNRLSCDFCIINSELSRTSVFLHELKRTI